MPGSFSPQETVSTPDQFRVLFAAIQRGDWAKLVFEIFDQPTQLKPEMLVSAKDGEGNNALKVMLHTLLTSPTLSLGERKSGFQFLDLFVEQGHFTYEMFTAPNLHKESALSCITKAQRPYLKNTCPHLYETMLNHDLSVNADQQETLNQLASSLTHSLPALPPQSTQALLTSSARKTSLTRDGQTLCM